MNMHVQIHPNMQEFVELKIRSGEYASVEEIVHAGLDALKQQETFGEFEPGELDTLLEEGERSIRERGTIDADTVFAEFRNRRQAESE